MPRFEVDWRMSGTATVDADDAGEAESLVSEALHDFETYRLEEIDVDDTEVSDITEVEDDD